MEDMDLICHLLLTLPKSYEALVTALETMHPQMRNMDLVKSRLIDENNKRLSANETLVAFNSSVAMNTKLPQISQLWKDWTLTIGMSSR